MVKVALAPESAPRWARDAIERGGGALVEPGEAEALVWLHPSDIEGLRVFLAAAPKATWVQLPWAGVERYAGADVFSDGRTWTCGKGVYAEPVAELALTLGLTGLRSVNDYVGAKSWSAPAGRSLYDGRLTVLGGGGICESLLELVAPFRVETTVVRRDPQPLAGAARTVGPDRLHDALRGADLVVLALALTPQTTGIIGLRELEAMEDHAWLVNVARGAHVVTDDLVSALRDGVIGGAGLDVTDPEPLPNDHPLWALGNCIVTPHTGNTPEMAIAPLGRRIEDNVRRFGDGEPLIGLVDPHLGY